VQWDEAFRADLHDPGRDRDDEPEPDEAASRRAVPGGGGGPVVDVPAEARALLHAPPG
jgi:hypothetical protein